MTKSSHLAHQLDRSLVLKVLYKDNDCWSLSASDPSTPIPRLLQRISLTNHFNLIYLAQETMTTVNLKQGILNLPGSTRASKKAIERLLAKDFDDHHCYFNDKGFHNHLSHHVLAAYDLGASEELLKAIYDSNASYQRPILLDQVEGIVKPGEINESNWKEHLGKPKYVSMQSFVLSF